MFVIANFIEATAQVLRALIDIYWWIIVVRVLISWINPDPYNPIVQFLRSATDPLLYWVRRALPLNFGGIDFSPIIVLLALQFLRIAVVNTLHQFAGTL